MISATTSDAKFLDVADIDDDGLDDVLLTVQANKWRIARRLDATGLNWDVYEKTLPVVSPGIGTVKAIRAVDIDGDGHLDVVHSFEGGFGFVGHRAVSVQNCRKARDGSGFGLRSIQ